MSTIEIGSPKRLEDVKDRIEEVSSKIAAGQAYLRVVAYPWGVEFDVYDVRGNK